MFWLKTLCHLALLTPFSLYLYWALSGVFSPDPGKQMILYLGHTAICVLLLNFSLPVLRGFTGFGQLQKLSRLTGLYGFFYACLHLLAYLAFVAGFSWPIFVEDIVERPYAFVAMLAFVILLLMAATSTKGWQRRLKKRWKLLHRLVYFALLLIVVHIFWVARSDLIWAYSYASVLLLLLAWRIFRRFKPVLFSK
jgi:sulfoxide reductase heme-binding subunit YedZ